METGWFVVFIPADDALMGHRVNVSALYFAFVYLRGRKKNSKCYAVGLLYQRQTVWAVRQTAAQAKR